MQITIILYTLFQPARRRVPGRFTRADRVPAPGRVLHGAAGDARAHTAPPDHVSRARPHHPLARAARSCRSRRGCLPPEDFFRWTTFHTKNVRKLFSYIWLTNRVYHVLFVQRFCVALLK